MRQGLEEVTEIVPQPMLLLPGNQLVSKANQAFYDTFKVDAKETENRSILELGNGQWSNPALRAALESVLPTSHKIKQYRVEHDFPKTGRRTFFLNARRLYQQSKGTHYILLLLQEAPTGLG